MYFCKEKFELFKNQTQYIEYTIDPVLDWTKIGFLTLFQIGHNNNQMYGWKAFHVTKSKYKDKEYKIIIGKGGNGGSIYSGLYHK